ncbi:unnamed protein product [Enterobius vermicularis]|uniref:CUB domain-containing protein n=1 Tax=Enterobius vermicularis TaxID=51028 RepID=A0A3P6HND8_ENTVE|nr:unnamed protein product [Enterobius vermicularis]
MLIERFLVKLECQTGYERFREACYHIFNYTLNFIEAEQFCVNDGGHLASVHDNEEAAFLVQMIKEKSALMIGYNGRNWTDGSSTSYIANQSLLLNYLIPSPVFEDRSVAQQLYLVADSNNFFFSYSVVEHPSVPFACERPAYYNTDRSCPQNNIFAGFSTVTSPGYPKKYHAGYNLNCTYYFAAESGHLGHIQFKDVDLNGDYVKVYDGWNPLERRAIGIVTGNNKNTATSFKTTMTSLISIEFIGNYTGKWLANFTSEKALSGGTKNGISSESDERAETSDEQSDSKQYEEETAFMSAEDNDDQVLTSPATLGSAENILSQEDVASEEQIPDYDYEKS